MSPDELRRGLGDAPLPDPERHWSEIRARLADGVDAQRAGLRASQGWRRGQPVRASLAIAATLAAMVLGVSGGVLFQFRAPAEWEIVAREGAVAAQQLSENEWLETDASSSARLRVGRIGSVAVGPESRVRLVRGAWNAHRMVLERGSIDAVIAAPPRLFFVETPTALATDLGCAYQLQVADDGSSTLRVTVGWVELSQGGHRSLVPAGLRASVSRDGVPGIPHAGEIALDSIEAAHVGNPSERVRAIVTALDAYDMNRPENIRRQTSGITLWHLLQRVAAEDRAQVVTALQRRAPLPAGATMEGILTLDRQMLDRWRRALHPMWGEEPAPVWVAAAQRIWLWVMS